MTKRKKKPPSQKMNIQPDLASNFKRFIHPIECAFSKEKQKNFPTRIG